MNILIIGDLMIDHYLWGAANRISPEAPIQIIDIQKETNVLGGAGNVVNNLTALGARVMVVSVVGDDENAQQLKEMLKDIDVEYRLVIDPARRTTKKSRIIAAHQQVVRYDQESRVEISPEQQEEMIQVIGESIKECDLVILSDYGKGVLADEVIAYTLDQAKIYGKKVLIDPKGKDYSRYRGATMLTPNKKEAMEATGIDITDNESLGAALQKLSEIASLEIPLITLSEDGIARLEEGRVIVEPTVAREVYDVTGAGDTVIAALGYSLARGESIEKAVRFANLAAGVVVGKLGSATATLDEIEAYKSSLHKSSIESHIKSFDEIERVVERLRAQKKKIVFTNGCFDILHRGHVSYLDIAKSFGDVLILGLNSDASVRRLKGEDRPINSEDDRAYILAALESVDYVVKFAEDTPYELIRIVRPDVLVKGGDYEGKEVVGSDIAGEVKLVNFVDGKSTTGTISKIQNLCGI